jgi:hypothetical protein
MLRIENLKVPREMNCSHNSAENYSHFFSVSFHFHFGEFYADPLTRQLNKKKIKTLCKRGESGMK